MGDRSKSKGLEITDEEWRILFEAPIRAYLLQMLGGERSPEITVHRQQCAAITNGCVSFLMWESRDVQADIRHLVLNGWRLDHSKWVCGLHPLKENEVEPSKEGT